MPKETKFHPGDVIITNYNPTVAALRGRVVKFLESIGAYAVDFGPSFPGHHCSNLLDRPNGLWLYDHEMVKVGPLSPVEAAAREYIDKELVR